MAKMRICLKSPETANQIFGPHILRLFFKKDVVFY